jgi:multidrug efflux pump
MTISDRAIEYPRLVILASILICVVGLAAVFTLPKERTPRVKMPVITVAVPNPGADPVTNEREIIRRLESESGSLAGLRDRRGIISQAVHGAAVVQYIFDHDVDVATAKQEVESLVNRVKGQFPPNAQQDPGPIVSDIAFDDFPIIQVFVAGGLDGAQRRRIAERLENDILQISGIAAVDMFGGLEPEVQIDVDPHLMTLYGFSYEEIAAAVQRANMAMPTGSIEQGSGAEIRVRAQAKFRSIGEIEVVPLGVRDGKPILLGDVAEVYMGHKPIKSIARYAGEDAVVLLVRAKTDIDVLATANRIQHLVDQFVAAGGSEDTHIGTVRSQAREINFMISQLGTSAMYGTVLVFLILWIALGWRNASLIGIAIPFAILTTAAIMWFTKRSITPDLAINNMTLFAMILVIGMVVDGCIIVGENIFRHRELGQPPMLAARKGIHEVGPSLICAYLTTFAAFAPMFLVRGIMGDFLQLMPVVVLFALCAAMVVDHFLLPVLSMYWMRVPRARLREAMARHRQRRGLSPEQIEIADAEAAVARRPVARIYGHMIRYCLRHRLMVLVMAVVVAMTPVGLFVGGAIGFEFFPDGDVPVVEVQYELPLGSSMQGRTVEVGRQIEQAVLRSVRPEEWYRPSPGAPRVRPVTTIGDPGALNIYLDFEGGVGPEYGMVYVELELAENRRRSSHQIRQAIVEELPQIPGVITRVKVPAEGPPTGAPVVVRLLGQRQTSLEELAARAQDVERILRGIPGTYDVSSDYRLRPELNIEPDVVVAGLFGIDVAQITTSVNFALEGVQLGQVDFGTDEDIDLRMRNAQNYRDKVEDLINLPIRSPAGRIATLDQVAQVERQLTANSIYHSDRRRAVSIRAYLEEGVLVDTVKARLVAALRPDLTPGEQRRMVMHDDVLVSDASIVIEFGGENEIRDDALADLNIAMLVAFAAMMIILTIRFNSFVQPLIVLFSVPLSLVGVTIGLMLCGFYFSISAMIGVVALAGIVVNDAIVLVDFTNRMRRTGVPLDKAVVYAAQLRVRPIFLTTVTTIGGLLPLGLNLSGGGEFWQPLTTTIMFGLAFATLLQLFVIPLAYYTFASGRRVSLLDPANHPELSGRSRRETPQPA